MNTEANDLQIRPLYQAPNSRIYWHDAQQTILVSEVTGRWDWDEGYRTINTLNQTIRQHARDVYTIHWFRSVAFTVTPTSAVRNLRNLIQEDPPNEKLVIFVGTNGILRGLINAVINAYRLTGLASKYYFVKTFDDALRVIETQRPQA